jgi:hypothetical protein
LASFSTPACSSARSVGGGFAAPQIFEFLEAQRCDYVVAMAKNARLARRATRLMVKARRHSKRTGRTAHVYGLNSVTAKVLLRVGHALSSVYKPG